MAGIYETDDEDGGQAPLVPLPTSRRPSRIAVAQYLSLAAGVVLVLAGLLMTLRDECPPGTVKIVRGAGVVDDAAGKLSIASFVSPLLSLSARSSLECTPRMRVTVDIRTVPSEPPCVACASLSTSAPPTFAGRSRRRPQRRSGCDSTSEQPRR